MHITYLYLPGRIGRIPKLYSGLVPTDFFYGAPELKKKGYNIKYIEVNDIGCPNKFWVFVDFFLKKKYLPVKVYIPLLLGVKKNIPELYNSDIVIATTPGIAFSLAIWKILSPKKVNFSIIAIHCGLFNYEQAGIRLILTKLLLRKMYTHIFGDGEFKKMMCHFKIPRAKITVNYFGVDESFWFPDSTQQSKDYILSIGNDPCRDYATLIQVARKVKKKIVLITKLELSRDIPDNMKIYNGSWHTKELSDIYIRELYQKSFCVIVPLKESFQPSGQSVTLQAMACGTPVILTRTKGLWDNENLKHGENILFSREGDVEGIISLLNILDNANVRSKIIHSGFEYISKYARIALFAERIELTCKKIINNGQI